jgi:hypothetical protein
MHKEKPALEPAFLRLSDSQGSQQLRFVLHVTAKRVYPFATEPFGA